MCVPASLSIDALIARAMTGGAEAEKDLSEFLTPGVRLLMKRRVNAQDVEDAVQAVLFAVIKAVRQGCASDPFAVAGYARTVAIRVAGEMVESRPRRRQLGAVVDIEDLTSTADSAEASVLDDERIQIAARLLEAANCHERQALKRFYLLGEAKERICSDMGLSDAQFRFIKNRVRMNLTSALANPAAAGVQPRIDRFRSDVA